MQFDGEYQTSIFGAINGLNLNYNNGNTFNVTILNVQNFEMILKVVLVILIEQMGVHEWQASAIIPFQKFQGNCNLKQVRSFELQFYFNSKKMIELCVFQ